MLIRHRDPELPRGHRDPDLAPAQGADPASGTPADDGSLQEQLGRALVAAGKLEPAGLTRAERAAAAGNESLVRALPKLGLVAERDLAALLADLLGEPLVRPEDVPDAPLQVGRLSPRFLKERCILPLAESEHGAVIAVADPLDRYAIDAFRLATGRVPALRIAEPSLIESAIDRLYLAGDDRVEPAAGDDPDVDVDRLKNLASEAPVVRWVNQLITKAVEGRASDIHIEPFEADVVVRYRVDGVLTERDPAPTGMRAAIVSRIKIMARLNIAERRLPQDGRVKMVVRGRAIDLRVSTLPTLDGESVVLRILDRDSVKLDFGALGLEGDSLTAVTDILAEPNGVFLVTGPTGSGKTTTLYAGLTHLASPEKKILTVEDPIEYQLHGVNQVQVKPEIGLTFAHVLRSILRQDPDIIMIGEIRDGETAKIAAQAALTGHLVLSTLHTNDAASAITRQIDMGVEDYLITSTLVGVSAQRLVRRLCPQCKEAYRPAPEVLGRFRVPAEAANDAVLYRAIGCEACNGRGYRGRMAIIETLLLNDRLRRMVLNRAEARELLAAAIEDGFRTMFVDGLDKAFAGETTLEEVLRSTREG